MKYQYYNKSGKAEFLSIIWNENLRPIYFNEKETNVTYELTSREALWIKENFPHTPQYIVGDTERWFETRELIMSKLKKIYNNSPTPTEKALEYYKAGVEKRKPKYVPSHIYVSQRVNSEFPFGGQLQPGAYEAYSNQYGAISAIGVDNQKFGLKPGDFEVLEWQPNPHLEK